MKTLPGRDSLPGVLGVSLLLLMARLALAAACPAEKGLDNFVSLEIVGGNLNPNIAKLYNLARGAASSTLFVLSPSQGAVYSYEISLACAAELFQLQDARQATKSSPTAASSIPPNPAGGSAASVVGDFNGDGNPDIALVNPGGNSVTVFLGTGAGSVGAGTTYPAGNAPASVAAADMDGDGHTDLVVANHGDNTVSVLPGNGDGTFRSAKSYPAGAGPAAIAIGDFNQDGRLDLAIGTQTYTVNSYSGAVEILMNTGSGFAPPLEYAKGSAPQSLVAADFDGDGILDLAVGDTNANQVRMLLGNKGGTFRAVLPVNVAGYPDYLAAADFNNDGKLDLAVLHGNAEIISVVMGNGDGTFGSPASYDAVYGQTSFFPVGYANGDGNLVPVGDFNGDGNLDLLVYDYLSNEVRILFGRGDGTFTGPPAYPFGTGPNATFLATGDFSGSGNLDAITDDQLTDAIFYFAGNGNGTFQQPVNLMQGSAIPQTGFSAAVVGDFNGDGRPDLAVAGRFGSSVTLLLNTGSGGFAAPVQFSSGGLNPTGIAAADFDGDGNLDLAVANSADYNGGTGSLVVFKGDGKGAFTQTASFSSTGLAPAAVAAADLNGDGKPDLVVTDAGTFSGSENGALYVLLNQGRGSFGQPAVYLEGTLPGPIAIGDVNGDHKPDLVVSNIQGVGVMSGNGDGTFEPPVYYTVAFGPTSIVIADLNADGKPDLILGSCCGPSEVIYLQGNGDGTFQPPFYMSAGASPSSVAVGDLNDDGLPDVLISGGFGGSPGSLIPILSTAPPSAFVTKLATAGQIEPFAAESIVSAYGANLATETAGATVVPLPLSLKGTTVTVLDAAGMSRQAPLFYVSQTQVNYEIPAGTALGSATVTITNGNGLSQVETIQIGAVSPGVFVLDSAGLVAAWVLPVISGVQQNLQPVYQVKSGGIAPLPVDLATPHAQYYLEIYGTGIRNASQVSVTVGGVNVPVLFHGAAPGYAGLDQVNIGPLPASLTGRGSVNISIVADGQTANTSNVTIQ